MKPDFWRGKRVLLTGHTGFKGSWMSLWLQALGADLTGYALRPLTCPNLFELADVAREMRSIVGDIRDESRLRRVMTDYRPEIVIHMAAQPLVHHSYAHPVETYSVNVMGTVNLMEAIRHSSGVRAVVNVTTDKCYENRERLEPYHESEPMGGRDPYSSSKACAEIVSAAYRSSFFSLSGTCVALATARAGNVIGGGDWSADRLVPDMLAAFKAGEPAAIRNPHAIRPWQHVLEPLRGYMMLAERLYAKGSSFAESWNFGPVQEDAQSVEWVAQRLADLWGDGARVRRLPDKRGHEATYLRLDVTKVHERLDWQPLLRLPEALNMVVNWDKQRMVGKDVKALTTGQIQAYQSLSRSEGH